MYNLTLIYDSILSTNEIKFNDIPQTIPYYTFIYIYIYMFNNIDFTRTQNFN